MSTYALDYVLPNLNAFTWVASAGQVSGGR